MHFRGPISILLIILLLPSCSRFEQVKRNKDVNYKYQMANKYFDKGDYFHANELYRDLMPVMKGTKNFEPMLFRMAVSFAKIKDYNNASYYFKFYTDLFPQGANLDEAAYLQAYNIYKMSPKVTVMQSNTEKALEVMQKFISEHPDSKHAEEAKAYARELQAKLEEKAALAAKLYYDISKYRAASVVYRNLQMEFPGSSRMDEYQFMIVKSNYKFAQNSVKEKKEERFVNVISAYQELVDNYPDSKYLKDAQKYFTLASNNIKKIKNEHQ